MLNKGYKTWVEIDASAIKSNVRHFRSILGKGPELWAVVKSNAYGHGLIDFSSLADVDGFCVDSVIEGLALREAGIKKKILVLGPTLPELLPAAVNKDIAVTVSNFESLKEVEKLGKPINFYLKIDTGMRRQGFYFYDLNKIIKEFLISNLEFRNCLKGVYTHFASAKDVNYPTYTEKQFNQFKEAVSFLKKSGFNNLIVHAAATGGILVNKKYHLDAARVGIGLYGLWPSKELEMQLPEISLSPALSWRAIISETKDFKKGDFIGYDLTEKTWRNGRLAIVPIGYWHGFDRGLSGGVGEVLIKGKRARVLGRVSMDMIAVDVSDIRCRYGDIATIIGQDGDDYIAAEEIAGKLNTTHYEVLTRINPLIKRIVKP